MEGLCQNQFKGVHMSEFPVLEDLLSLKLLLYDIDIIERSIVGELARRSVQKYAQTGATQKSYILYEQQNCSLSIISLI